MNRSLSSWSLLALMAVVVTGAARAEEDPWLWLEEIEGERSLSWVEEQNRRTLSEYAHGKTHDEIFKDTLQILDSQDRIPYPAFRGDHVYNFWQDQKHERGIWRRTSHRSYRSDEPKWQTLLDLDELSAREGVPWVFKSVDCLEPDFVRCVVSLSPGGADATALREFDTVEGAFVDGGFETPEAKTWFAWKDRDALWIATDFGEGSLTTSGYPRVVKEWRRGTPLETARTVFQGEPTDILAVPQSIRTVDGHYDLIMRARTFFDVDTFMVLGDRLVRLDVPTDAEGYGIFRDHLLLSLRSDWEIDGSVLSQGSLVAVAIDGLLMGSCSPEVIFEPTDRSFLDGVAVTRDHVVMTTLDNVRGRLFTVSYEKGSWTRAEIELPGFGTVGIGAWPVSEPFYFTYQDFVTPASLFIVESGRVDKVKSQPEFFDATGVGVAQRHAVSADGTRIPYFLVTPKGFEPDGTAPTILTGYGGFEVNMLPDYSGSLGKAWLERGGAFVLANLRGGGEFGPAWHQAGLRENRINWFEDFIAVAENLVSDGTTSRERLAIVGGSNGGLLVGGVFTMRPDLCQAVVCQVPLLDMKRYHLLLAGASWISEYGNPDVAGDWDFMKHWSPYHNLDEDAQYPTVLFWTNHRDDRVHPGHGRKMTAEMLRQGHDVYYFEHLEGGHGSGSVSRQKAELAALEYAFLWRELDPEDVDP